jgi:hypothetical protein
MKEIKKEEGILRHKEQVSGRWNEENTYCEIVK